MTSDNVPIAKLNSQLRGLRGSSALAHAVERHLEAPKAKRRLAVPSRWTDCYNSDNIARKFAMGFAMDAAVR